SPKFTRMIRKTATTCCRKWYCSCGWLLSRSEEKVNLVHGCTGWRSIPLSCFLRNKNAGPIVNNCPINLNGPKSHHHQAKKKHSWPYFIRLCSNWEK